MLITWDNGIAHLKKSKQLFEYQHLLFLRYIGGQSSNLFFMLFIFLILVLIRHLCLLNTVVFQHSCLKQEQDSVLWNIYL
jgi:hypothetical protein